jgi:hypothetical protein
MSNQNLMEVRTALQTGTNTTGVLGSGAGGAEIQKKIDELPVDAFNKLTDLRPLIRSVNINQLAYIWNVVEETSTGSSVANSSFTFYSETADGTPEVTSKQQLYSAAKAYRADYEVSNLMIAAGMANQLTEEARYAAEAMAIGEEKQIILGLNSTAGGSTTGFQGLYGDFQSTTKGGLMLNGVTATTQDGLGDTSTIYGTVRSTTNTGWMSPQAHDAVGTTNGGTATDLTAPMLDSIITKSNKRGAKKSRRILLMSEERVDKLAQLLDDNRRFITTGNTIEFDGGFRILAYQRIPVIGSRFMDVAGILQSSGTTTAPGNSDNSIFLLDLDSCFMAYVAGVNAVHTPILGQSAASRSDVRGGYYKSYGSFIMKRLDTSGVIFNLADI